MSAPQAFPQSEPNDSDNVADALDAGLLHWVKGEKSEALRCLRNARAAADDAGDDHRALTLARVAAELTPEDAAVQTAPPAVSSASAAPLAAASESQSTDARRSKLPEPPAPLKKFTGASDSASTPAAKMQAGRASVPASSAATSTRPQAVTTSERSGSGNGAATSIRPFPPSARASASPPGIANGEPAPGIDSPVASPARSSLASKVPVTANSANNPSAAPTRDVKGDASKVELSATKTDVSAAFSSRSSQAPASTSSGITETRAKFGTQPVSQLEHRSSSRPEPADHRLASLRVKIERVDADGHVHVKLLDLAATAGGEDNAILVVPQSLWQELKRGN